MLKKLVCLAENTSPGCCRAVHGLSVYIETDRCRLLFDLGPDGTAFDNAKTLGIDLSRVDLAVISHGHNDHGGGLGRFLEISPSAPVYVHEGAFEPHQSTAPEGLRDISLDPSLREHPRVHTLREDTALSPELTLFTAPGRDRWPSSANDTLLENGKRDLFTHEMHLLIRNALPEGDLLLMGCGHSGVINILLALPVPPALCVGGFHLFRPRTGETVPDETLKGISEDMKKYPDTVFYTCHCTGPQALARLSALLPGRVRALHCGDTLLPEEISFSGA